MEAVNGVSDGGPPPPSPLTGCYLLVVIGEPHSQEHKDIILRRVAKGLLSWDLSDCMVDLEKELAIITEQAPEGEEARYGERLIQYASENLVTEILIHPAVSTLSQCVRNLLSSFTRHRHIIHSGYTFAANGSWALQDGTFSLADFSEAFQELEVQRVIRAYDNGISVDIHCSPEGDWTRVPKEPFAKNCKVRLNPVDVLPSSSLAIADFLNYITPYLVPLDIVTALESSEVVGNIRFSHPTLYVFPGGQGDAALFGINGFNMLLDGGFSRKACFWDFVRHLDRLDAVLLTRLNNSNVSGITSVLKRKRQNAVYPQIGHFFCNIQERKALLSPDGDKDRDPLLINLMDEGQDIVTNLKHLNLHPQTCYRDSEPINLYHKVGHGTLDMYVLSPAKDSREVREFIQKWNSNDNRLFSNPKTKEFSFPLPNLVSICALLVWQPSNSSENITRILFPGSTPQSKIFEGLDRLKQLDCIKYPICSEISLNPPKKTKEQIFDSSKSQKILPEVKKEKSPRLNDIKPKEPKEAAKQQDNKTIDTPEIKKEIKKSDSTDSDKSAAKPNNKAEIKTAKDAKETTTTSRTPRIRDKDSKSVERKPSAKIEKKPSPTTPKKTIANGDATKPKATKVSPTTTPAKSAKEASNRKVLESKKQLPKEKKESKPADKKGDAEKKVERKPISRRPKPAAAPAVKAATGSPIRKKPDSIAKKAKLDKEGTTDSSTVSTPTADVDVKRDISKLTPEELDQLKAQELADLQEEQEVVQEIEAVFRKGEEREASESEMRKIKNISIEEKTDEEYLVIEKVEVEVQEDEIQKLIRDSEESEKQRKLSDPKVEPAKEIISPEEKVDKVESGTQPDEKFSATVESGATTAPTLPEDERIPLDEIKEKDDTQVIEEKHVKEETKEKDSIPVIQLPSKSIDSTPPVKAVPVVGIRLDKQQHIRDIVKTPDEVADLPVHEVADHYADYQKTTDEQTTTIVKEALQDAKTDVQKAVEEVKEEVKAVVDEIFDEVKDKVKAVVEEIIEESKDIVDKSKETVVNDVEAVDAEKESVDINIVEESKQAVEETISEVQKTAVDVSNVIKEDLVDTKELVTDEKVEKEEIKEVQTETKEVEEKVKEEVAVEEISEVKHVVKHTFEETKELVITETNAEEIKVAEKKESEVKDEVPVIADEVVDTIKSDQTKEEQETTKKDESLDEVKHVEAISEEKGVTEVNEKVDEEKPSIDSFEKEVEQIVGAITKTIEDTINEKLTDTKETVDSKISKVEEVSEVIHAQVDEKIKDLKDVEKTVDDTVSTSITKVEETTEQIKSAVQDEVLTKVSAVQESVTEKIESTKETVRETITKASTEIEEIKEMTTELVSEAKAEISKVSEDISQSKQAIEQEAVEIVDKVKTTVKEETDSISGFFSKGLSKLEETTKSIGDKLVEEVGKVLGETKVDEKETETKELKETDSSIAESVPTVETSIVVQNVDVELPEVINLKESPESPCPTPFDYIDKVDLGRKSPKEREQDVAKIVASVAEVLKSEAPLEEFKGKIPLEITTFPTFTPYTTELRETHITTVDSPITDMPGQITPIKEEKIDEVLKEMEDDIDSNSNTSKINTLIKTSNELLEASSKIISDIKERKEDEIAEEDEEVEENVDTGTVHRMLVTASSEDGGEETVICPPGSITFPKSSESSGKSSPDLRKDENQKPETPSPESSQDAPSVLQKEPEISAKMKSEDIPETKDKVDKDDKKPEIAEQFEDNKATEERLEKESESRKSSIVESADNKSEKSTEVSKSGKSTPDLAKSGKTTPDVSKSGKATPDIPTSGKATPDIPLSGKATPDIPISDKATPDIPKSGKSTPDISKSDKTTPDVSKVELAASDIAASGKATPDVSKSGKATPDIPTSGKATPDVSKSGLVTPDIPTTADKDISDDKKSGKSTPDDLVSATVSATEKPITSNIAQSGKSSPELSKSGKATPDMAKSEVATSDNQKSGKSTPDIPKSGKETPHIPKSTATPADIPISVDETVESVAKSGKLTPDISKSDKTLTDTSKTAVGTDILETDRATPDSHKSGKSTPDVTKSDKATPEISKPATPDISVTPGIQTSGKSTPDIPKSEKEMANVSKSGSTTPDIPASDRGTPVVPKSGKSTPDVIPSGKATPDVPHSPLAKADISTSIKETSDTSKSGKSTPDLSKADKELLGTSRSGLATPDIPTPVRSTPDIPKSGKSTPDIPKSGVAIPESPTFKQTDSDLLKSGKATPEITNGKITPDSTKDTVIDDVILKSGKSTPDIKSEKITAEVLKPETITSDLSKPDIPSGKATPDISKSGKSTPDIPKSGKETPDITKSDTIMAKRSSIVLESDKSSIVETVHEEKSTVKSVEKILADDVSEKHSEISKIDEKVAKTTSIETESAINGKISPDLQPTFDSVEEVTKTTNSSTSTTVEDKKCEISSVTTAIETLSDSKEEVQLGTHEVTTELSNMTCCTRIENEKLEELSNHIVDEIGSGKSTPEINNISGKSSPEIPKTDVLPRGSIPRSPALSGKGTPDVSKSGKSSPDFGKGDSIKLDTDSLASGKQTPDVNVDLPSSVAPYSVQMDTDSLASGKMTPDLKHDLSSGKATPDVDKFSTHIETDSLASGKLTPDVHKGEVLSGKSTPDMGHPESLAEEKTSISSGKSTPSSNKDSGCVEKSSPQNGESGVDSQKGPEILPSKAVDTKDDSVHIDDNLKSGKSTPDLGKDQKTILSGKVTPEVPVAKKDSIQLDDSLNLKVESLATGKSTPDLKPSEASDSRKSSIHADHVVSGKSTPDITKIDDKLVSEKVSIEEKLEKVVSEKISSSIEESATLRKESLQATTEKAPSGKSTPDISKETKESGKSSPDVQTLECKRDSVTIPKDVSGKSTPDPHKDKLQAEDTVSVTSGKTTPDLGRLETMTIDEKVSQETHKVRVDEIELLSGKSSPDVDDLQCHLPSGKSTPISPDHQNGLSRDSIASGKSTPGLSGKVTPEPDISSGKVTPEPAFPMKSDLQDLKDEMKALSGKSTPDSGFNASRFITTTSSTIQSSIVTTAESLKQEIKTHSFAGSPSPDFAKRSSIQAEHILSGKSTPDSTKLSHHDDSGKSTPDFGKRSSMQAEHLLSGKSTPDFAAPSDLTKKDSLPISGQSTPLRGKSSPDVHVSDEQGKTTTTISDVSSSFDVTQLQSAHVFRELMEETITSSFDEKKTQNGDILHEKHDTSKLEMVKETISGKSTPEFAKDSRKSSVMSGADDSDYRKFSITSENTKTSSMMSGKSTPDRKEEKHTVQAFIDAERQTDSTPSPSKSERKPSQGELMSASGFHADPMSTSFYGALPVDSDEEDIDRVQPRNEPNLMTSSFIGDLPTDDKTEEEVRAWGKPLGLPSPAPPNDNKGTPKKEKRLPMNVSVKNKLNQRSESPSKKKKINPVYVDLTYVPHHGNSYYSQVDFFKRVRARYYVFSGIEPSKDVYNALLEAKQTWEDKDLEVTIIPTYDTDVLGYWVAENEELLTKFKIDLSPSASRCTINLQDHETSCSAYRLEF